MDKKKVFAIASIGGHWVQLLRVVRPLEEHYEVVYLSTHTKCATMVEGHRFLLIGDYSRWDAWKMLPAFGKYLWLMWKERPDVVITTGAAPGLVALLAARLTGRKTIWVDSIANAEHLSASGRIASHFASRTYTQWEPLATGKIVYAGNIFG